MPTSKAVIDFDHHSAEFAADPWTAARRLAAESPVAWSDHHDGFWLISGHEHLVAVTQNPEVFSSHHDVPNGSSIYQGINVPPSPMQYLPIEVDPPEHIAWRQALGRFFSRSAVEALIPVMQDIADRRLDDCIESGEIDFVNQFTGAVPTMTTLHMLGLPLEGWQDYADAVHRMNGAPAEERMAAYLALDQCVHQLVDVVKAGRANPRDDLLGCLATMEIDGAPLTDEQIWGTCVVFIAGGIETTSSAVAGGIKYLHENPAARRRLIEEPDLLPGAVEEFVRYVTPVPTLARTATRDVELGGQQIRAGDRIVLLWFGGNMDASVFACPESVALDRKPNHHLGFGFGPHRCLGASLARAQAVTMLGTVLDRIPDYELLPGAVRYASIGLGHNYYSLPARFTPGERRAQREEGSQG